MYFCLLRKLSFPRARIFDLQILFISLFLIHVLSLPTLYVIGPDGRIVYSHIGFRLDSKMKLIQLLNRLIKVE